MIFQYLPDHWPVLRAATWRQGSNRHLQRLAKHRICGKWLNAIFRNLTTYVVGVNPFHLRVMCFQSVFVLHSLSGWGYLHIGGRTERVFSSQSLTPLDWSNDWQKTDSFVYSSFSKFLLLYSLFLLVTRFNSLFSVQDLKWTTFDCFQKYSFLNSSDDFFFDLNETILSLICKQCIQCCPPR